MFGFIKKLFGGKPAETTAEAPYKVETPANTYESYKYKVTPAVESAVTEVATPSVEAVVETAEAPAQKKKPAPKKRQNAKKAPAEKKPVAPKKEGAPKKGGRKPKAQ